MFVLQLSGLGLVCMCNLKKQCVCARAFGFKVENLWSLSVFKRWTVQVKTDWNMLCSLSLLKRKEKPIETQGLGASEALGLCPCLQRV